MVGIKSFHIYSRHTKEMIQKLESAGLGYHVSADETEDKLGMIFSQKIYDIYRGYFCLCGCFSCR